MKEKKIEEARKYLKEMHADGWLLYDFHRNNELAHQFLEIPQNQVLTRRFFYWIPVKGEPVKIVHAIESSALDAWPGRKETYLSWQSLDEQIGSILKGQKIIAMEYSPRNAIPYVSKVDAGTMDLVRSFGVEVVSSGDFLPHFTAVMDEKQAQSHIRAGKALDRIVNDTWKWIGEHLKQGKKITEYDIQQKIVSDFAKNHLFTDHDPIVGFNAHSADPHYAPEKNGSSTLKKGDWILIDLWAKETDPRSVFGDITRVGVAAERPTARQQEIYQIVRNAQKAATDLIRNRFEHKKRIEGWEADDAARNVIRKAGYADYFSHRTGHSIEINLHGSGTHIDNLEMHDERPILPGTCFSIEPGIYFSGDFGVRLEYDIYVHKDGKVEIVGGEQDEIVCLL